jgi:hypothetical protein
MTYVSYFRGYKTENTACAAKSIAYGPGLTEAKTNRDVRFWLCDSTYVCARALTKNKQNLVQAGYTVELKNDEGERVKLGGTNVTGVMVLGEERIKVTVVDNKDGSYSCTYNVAKPGTYELNVLCEAQHIKDSPFHPVVEPSEAAASTSTANPPNPQVAGEPVEFTITSRDINGNDKPDGGEEFSATLGSVEADVKDNGDGTYAVSYTPEKAGDFELKVLLKTDNIKDSPFAITVKPANPDASKTTAEGAGIASADTDAPATFKVVTRDRFGNECIEGGFKVVAGLVGKGDVDGQKVCHTLAICICSFFFRVFLLT